jgi:hypothetical protein
VFSSDREHILDVLGEAQLAQGLVNVLGGDGLLGLVLCDLVGLGGDQRDELDAAVDEQVARVLAKGQARFVAQDLADDLLDGGYGARLRSAGLSLVLLPLTEGQRSVQLLTFGEREVVGA